MQFFKQIQIPPHRHLLTHADLIGVWGSCFAENVQRYLVEGGFRVHPSPYGIMYNPLSIARGIEIILDQATPSPKDIISRDGNFYSYMHHGKYTAKTEEALLQQISEGQKAYKALLPKLNILFITWGTAFVYFLKADGKVVSNCHKQPENLFTRELITVETIVKEWQSLLHRLLQVNPHLEIVLSVSPIRHYRDGIHANTLSKSTLQLAAHKLIEAFPEQLFYFPSYELLLDELRDYRFYAEDMVHPSSTAIAYIMERMSQTFLSPATQEHQEKWRRAHRFAAHLPSPDQKEQHQAKADTLLQQLTQERDQLFPPNL